MKNVSVLCLFVEALLFRVAVWCFWFYIESWNWSISLQDYKLLAWMQIKQSTHTTSQTWPIRVFQLPTSDFCAKIKVSQASIVAHSCCHKCTCKFFNTAPGFWAHAAAAIATGCFYEHCNIKLQEWNLWNIREHMIETCKTNPRSR